MFSRLLILLLSFFILVGHAPAQSHPGIEQVQFISSYDKASPGQKLLVGVRFILEPQWHVYWINPGDSGLPPTFSFDSQDYFSVGEVAWPLPERIPVAHLLNFGYEGEVVFPFMLTFNQDLQPGDLLNTRLLVNWLVCQEDCIPGSEEFEVNFDVVTSGENELNQWNEQLTDAYNNSPHTRPEEIAVSANKSSETLNLNITNVLPADSEFEYFFPKQQGLVDYAQEQTLARRADQIILELPLAVNAPSEIDNFSGILRYRTDSGETDGVFVVADIQGPPALDLPEVGGDANEFSLWKMLLFGFLGGLILNLMPCVFPIISIKVFSFISHAKSDPKKTKLHGILFGIGVVASFWFLALLLILLRASGETLGWGFQLQSPLFIWAMCFLFTALALNLMGVFELGAKLQQIGGRVPTGSGYLSSFFTGVLATVVASPCTAPFMANALSFALLLPPTQSLLIFTALGVGMAGPYVILSFFPGLVSLLPKGGEWMVTLKKAMAFPLLATVIWLLSVYLRQVNAYSVLELLAALLLFSLALFIYGRTFFWKKFRVIGVVVSLLLLVISLAWSLPDSSNAKEQGQQEQTISDQINGEVDQYGLFWQTFSRESLEILKQGNDPIFIDFTAQWCITCLANKRLVFSSERVQEYIKENNVRLVRADWTNMDDEITETLAEFDRSGVPFNLLYPKGGKVEPVEFPSLLTAGTVLRIFRENINGKS